MHSTIYIAICKIPYTIQLHILCAFLKSLRRCSALSSSDKLFLPHWLPLSHWGRATHICQSKLTIIASDNGLSPGRRLAIILNNAGILSIGLLGTNFIEILIEILIFSFRKMCLKVSSAKWRPFCLGLHVLNTKLLFNIAELCGGICTSFDLDRRVSLSCMSLAIVTLSDIQFGVMPCTALNSMQAVYKIKFPKTSLAA